ncbi:ATP-binding cassette domain-containing protein [Arsenicicoccus dermatophilus]|uniref:ATP-binding cassette domain-containing protein n=1 Tax=Arsenicicoccus dermatophilus TaxID=1076331 RepID=UPI001F4D259E|nr:ABC transporter ATP-binding protein [Arsenicicoccus dermatophilus]
MPPVVDVRSLCVDFGSVRALHDVSLRVDPGHRLGIIGGSGSGKTLTASAMLGLLPASASWSGEVLLQGRPTSGLHQAGWRRLRGATVALVAQDPRSALNPLVRVGDQVAEPLRATGVGRRDATRRALDLLEAVRLPDPARVARRRPGDLSGGQRQRVAIALALAADPTLLVADEPTSALDVSVQADVLPLLTELAGDRALVLITHDLAVAAQVCTDLVVLGSGRVLAAGPVDEVLARTDQPEVVELLAATHASALPQRCARCEVGPALVEVPA